MRRGTRAAGAVFLAGGALVSAALVATACANYLDADAGAVDDAPATEEGLVSDATSPSDGTPPPSDAPTKSPEAGDEGAADGDADHDAGLDAVATHDAPSTPDAKSDSGTVSAYAAAVLADSPLLYLRFDDDGSSGLANDLTGNGHSGTYPTGGVTYGYPGALATDPDPAIHLAQPAPPNHANSVVMPPCADFNGGTDSFTIELWFDADADASAGLLVDHNIENPYRAGWDLNLQLDPVEFDRGWWNDDDAGLLIAFSNTFTPMTGAWHYLVAVFNDAAQEQYVYLDDVEGQYQQNTQTIDLPILDAGWMVGGENCPCTGGFSGAIDELAVYDHALPQARIDAHWAAATGK